MAFSGQIKRWSERPNFLTEKSQILVTLFFPLFLAHFFPLVMLTTFFDNGLRIT